MRAFLSTTFLACMMVAGSAGCQSDAAAGHGATTREVLPSSAYRFGAGFGQFNVKQVAPTDGQVWIVNDNNDVVGHFGVTENTKILFVSTDRTLNVFAAGKTVLIRPIPRLAPGNAFTFYFVPTDPKVNLQRL